MGDKRDPSEGTEGDEKVWRGDSERHEEPPAPPPSKEPPAPPPGEEPRERSDRPTPPSVWHGNSDEHDKPPDLP
jgi:hypothetical protein